MPNETALLKSIDMQAFKAANPGCVLEDFVRWYSPADWVEESEGDLINCSYPVYHGYHLSFCPAEKAKKNINRVKEAWQEENARRAERAKREDTRAKEDEDLTEHEVPDDEGTEGTEEPSQGAQGEEDIRHLPSLAECDGFRLTLLMVHQILAVGRR